MCGTASTGAAHTANTIQAPTRRDQGVQGPDLSRGSNSRPAAETEVPRDALKQYPIDPSVYSTYVVPPSRAASNRHPRGVAGAYEPIGLSVAPWNARARRNIDNALGPFVSLTPSHPCRHLPPYTRRPAPRYIFPWLSIPHPLLVTIESSTPNYSDKAIQPTTTAEPSKSTRNTKSYDASRYCFTVLPDRNRQSTDTALIGKLSLARPTSSADDAY
jgi:hypothetical protein